MTAQAIKLDDHRSTAAKVAAEARHLLAGVRADQRALQARLEELETQLISLLAATPVTRDPLRMKLIAAVIEDMRRLSATDAEGGPGT